MRVRTTLTAVSLASVAVLGAAGTAAADADAKGAAVQSPGALSGNVLQVPLHLGLNACGNTVDIIALLNPTFGNTCVNK